MYVDHNIFKNKSGIIFSFLNISALRLKNRVTAAATLTPVPVCTHAVLGEEPKTDRQEHTCKVIIHRHTIFSTRQFIGLLLIYLLFGPITHFKLRYVLN
jgi:hypothetical protein